MKTTHNIIFEDSAHMEAVPSDSVDLIVTSPPYPMIKMWDDMFCMQNSGIRTALKNNDGLKAFGLMHKTLEPIWNECYRVLKNGRFACINIADATRTSGGNFQMYPNHSRVLNYLKKLGFDVLPDIVWHKQNNAPNKFMGSGMLPAGAYVTLEHEYILIMRKGGKRLFQTAEEKQNRMKSALFWEERNIFFSDIWTDIKGTGQNLENKKARQRSGAYPFEVAYRLINMYSVKGDMVIDPFFGTGTTGAAAMVSGRNSMGYEIDPALGDVIFAVKENIPDFANEYIKNRLERHIVFVKRRTRIKGKPKYINRHYGFPVMTKQETELVINELRNVKTAGENCFEVFCHTG